MYIMHKHLFKLFFIEKTKRAVLVIYCNILVIYVFSKVALFMFHILRFSNGSAFKRKKSCVGNVKTFVVLSVTTRGQQKSRNHNRNAFYVFNGVLCRVNSFL